MNTKSISRDLQVNLIEVDLMVNRKFFRIMIIDYIPNDKFMANALILDFFLLYLKKKSKGMLGILFIIFNVIYLYDHYHPRYPGRAIHTNILYV